MRKHFEESQTMLTFSLITSNEAGTLASLLIRSYAELLREPYWEGEKKNLNNMTVRRLKTFGQWESALLLLNWGMTLLDSHRLIPDKDLILES